MRIYPLLQTVEDRDNADEVEERGPFKCISAKAWLGVGYYFWDRFEKIAHWWGGTCYPGGYMICQAEINIHKDDYLDLAGNTEQMERFSEFCSAVESRLHKELTLSQIIEYLKKNNKFPYKAIRAHSIDCGEGDCFFRMRFIEKKSSYINLNPALQICVIDRAIVSGYHIIYPEDYVQVV